MVRDELISISAELLTNCGLSDFQEDYSFRVPKHHLSKIEKMNDRLREVSIKIRDIADKTKQLPEPPKE